MALGYPSHDNVKRMHKLFPKVAREPLSSSSIHIKIRAEYNKCVILWQLEKHTHLGTIIYAELHSVQRTQELASL